LVSEIVKEDERAARMSRLIDDDDDDDEDFLNSSTHNTEMGLSLSSHGDNSLFRSSHGDLTSLNRSFHGDSLNRSTHSDIGQSGHGEDWLDDILDMDPLAEIYFNEILSVDSVVGSTIETQNLEGRDSLEDEQVLSLTPSFSRSSSFKEGA
jgi:hypothetical protein